MVGLPTNGRPLLLNSLRRFKHLFHHFFQHDPYHSSKVCFCVLTQALAEGEPDKQELVSDEDVATEGLLIQPTKQIADGTSTSRVPHSIVIAAGDLQIFVRKRRAAEENS